MNEQLEKKQKLDRERRAKQKHLDHLQEIVNHGEKLGSAHRAHEMKFVKLGKSLLKFHGDAEKEEAKRKSMGDFYRFQGRERRKEEQGELIKRFEEDRKRVEGMKNSRRGRFVPE